MKYRQLSSSGDYVLGGPLATTFYVDNVEAVAQAIGTRLRLAAGEWFLDQREGTPYSEQVLGKGTTNLRDAAIANRILDTPGVLRLLGFSSSLDEQRRYSVTASVSTIYGDVTVTLPL